MIAGSPTAQGGWIETLLRGTYELPITRLTLRHGASGEYQGSGRIVWDAEKGIHLHATTNDADSSWELLGRGLPAGQFLPEEHYLVVNGETIDGAKVTAHPATPDGLHIHADSAYIAWNQKISGLAIKSGSENPAQTLRVLRALLGPPLTEWPRISRSTIENPFFGQVISGRDWLSLEKAGWNLAARQRSKDWFEVRLVLAQGHLGERTLETLDALSNAFGFLTGRNLFVRGYEEEASEGNVRFLSGMDRKSSRAQMRVPLAGLPLSWDYTEELLGRVLSFFLTPRGRNAAVLLWVCRDAADRSFHTREVVTSVCLEGLLKIVPNGAQDTDCGYTEEDIIATREWLRENVEALSERFVQRIEGFLGSLGHQRPKDILRVLQRKGLAVPGDILAWEKTRNPAAHAGHVGSLDDSASLQKRFSRLCCLEDLINRLVLHLVEYRGKYVSYAEHGWPVMDFPSRHVDEKRGQSVDTETERGDKCLPN